LLSDGPEARRKFVIEQRERARREKVLAEFERFRNEHIEKLTDEYRRLFHESGLAIVVLREFPDCEAAWDALADFYHNEGRLQCGLDYLCCTKATSWLAPDASIKDVFSAWRERQGRAA
jgi:hypothetical protein